MDTALLSIDEAISDCIMNMTDFNPKTNTWIFGSLVNQMIQQFLLKYGSDRDHKPMSRMLTGSVAELTIKTPLPCFGDSDFLVHIKRAMVLPNGTGFLTNECLRKYRGNRIELWSYRQTEFPAYVRLYFVGILSFDKDMGIVTFDKAADRSVFFSYSQSLSGGERFFDGHFFTDHDKTKKPSFIHGPAFTMKLSDLSAGSNNYHKVKMLKSIDMVVCIFCPHWPPEARDFCERNRPHGWPTRSTIEEVVSLGCDFVQVSHPLYKKQEVEPQWRISFSRAEIILIRTWSNTQKIVYHLLRYLNKNTEIFKDHVICTYHLKTLMLWNCEKRPPEYWNCHLLMHIVADMLSELKQCVQEERLQSYFIPNCNLMFKIREQPRGEGRDNAHFTELTRKKLSSVSINDLIDWFLRNYLFVLAAKCPENEPRKMIMDFQLTRTNALINDIDWIKTFTQVLSNDFVLAKILCEDLEFSTYLITSFYDSLKSRQNSCRYVIGMLEQADARLINFFRAYILLNAAQEIEKSKQLPNRWLVGIILDVGIDYKDCNNCIWEFATYDDNFEGAAPCFNMALFILRMITARKQPDANVLLMELAKCCFKKSLEYSDSFSISLAARVYLAIISYEQRLYEEAIDLCMLVIESSFVQKMRGINRDILKTLDLPYLSVFFGFAELFLKQFTGRDRCVKTKLEYPPVVIAIMLLKDILDSCSSYVSRFESLKEKLNTRLDNHSCRRHQNAQLKQSKENSENGCNDTFTLRIVLECVKDFSNLQRKSNQKTVIYYRRSVSYLPKIADDLFNALLDLSTKYLTAFRRSVREDLEPSKNLVLTDQYMMLYSFRCGDYLTALEISDEMIAYHENSTNARVPYSIGHAIASPPFRLLLDDQLKKFIIEYKNNYRPGPLFIETWVLALYIKTECQLKLEKSVFHFLLPVHQLFLHATIPAFKPFSLSALISQRQLEKLMLFFRGVFNNRLEFLPDGKLRVISKMKHWDNPDISEECVGLISLF